MLNCSDQTRTGVFNFVWLFTFKMYRKELALICILIQEAYVKKFFSKRAFLHILNVYSHTKLNTPVLVWSLQLSNFGLTHVTEHFSVTIDCVRFLIRRFPLYTYSMVISKTLENFFSFRRTSTLLKSLSERQFIIGKPLTYIDHTLLIMVVNPHYNSIVFVLFIFFSLSHICWFYFILLFYL